MKSCAYAKETLGNIIQLKLASSKSNTTNITTTTTIDLNLDDVLVNKTVECQLNMMVHLDPNIRDKD
jgi:hypothetical protein